MSQFLSQSLMQGMRMEQRLTPQLIQSMAILQKPVADLEACINEALEGNAALEIVEPQPVESEAHEEQRPPNEVEDSFARLDRFSGDYDLDMNDARPFPARRAVSSDERDPKMAAIANTPGRETNLHDHLLAQWALLDLDEETQRAGETIIANIDPDGYLRVSMQDLAERVRPPLTLESLDRALAEVHRLEPRGIGARDVVESLLLQLDAQPGDNEVERVLIEHHLSDITHNRLPAVARATGYTVEEISEAIRAMRSMLCLHPGFLVGDRTVPTIRPDVVIDYAETGGGLTVRLTRGNMPELCIRKDVMTIAKSKANGKEARDFARKQVEDATALIDAVNFRRSRLLEVSKAIVERQRAFFDVGPRGLKVFRMSDLAVELGCDPSTVSRTVAEKYMQTPRGIFPLRYFFTGGTENEEGESMGWDRVKVRVRELVDGEDPKSPFNDDQIAALLKKEGIEISRRTVAKYRQQLGILNARQRRSF